MTESADTSPITKVTLLLSARVEGADGGRPLSPSEYHQLAQWLESRGETLARLLRSDARIVLRGYAEGERILKLLSRGSEIDHSLGQWKRLGIWTLGEREAAFPARLRQRLRTSCLPLLFGAGRREILNQGGLCVVGSRDSPPEAHHFAREIGTRAGKEDLVLISSDMRGIDREATSSVLSAGGRVVCVLSDSLEKAVVSRRYRDALATGRALLVTPFAPDTKFTVANAMRANRYQYGLSDAAIIVETRQTGGVWSGADENRKHGWVPAFVRAGTNVSSGNSALLHLGLLPISDRDIEETESLSHFLIEGATKRGAIPVETEPNQAVHGALFEVFVTGLQSALGVISLTDEAVAEHFGIELAQARTWLARARTENRIPASISPYGNGKSTLALDVHDGLKKDNYLERKRSLMGRSNGPSIIGNRASRQRQSSLGGEGHQSQQPASSPLDVERGMSAARGVATKRLIREATMNKFKYDKYDFSAGIRQYKAIMEGRDAEFAPVTTQMAEFCMKYGGHNGRRFFSDPELFVRGNLDVQQEFGFDVPDMVWDVYSVESEALGGDMAWFDELYPALDNTRALITNEKELAKMKAPDPFKTGRMPWVLEVLQLCEELTGFPHHIHYCAPINLCAQVMQFEKMVVAIAERPKFVHKVMDWLVEEVLAPYINAYFKVVPGAAIANGKDAVGSLPFITEEMVHEFSIPYIDKLRKLTGNRPGLRCDNWWGDAFAENAEKYWDIKLHVTPQYLKVQDPDCFRIGTERIRKYADTKGCALSFGVGTLLLQKGSREDITRRVHEYMEVGSRGPHGKKFFLYFCSFSAQTPTENVKAAIDAVKSFRAGERPYAGEVLSGPGGVAAEMAGGKGFMGMGLQTEDKTQAREDAAAIRTPIFQTIYNSVMEFDGKTCAETVAQALEEGATPNAILDEGLIPPMAEVGDLFAAGEFFVPEMLMAAKAMKQGLEVLRPVITSTKTKPKGIIVTATVFGDLHDIGKNLVGMMLEGAGFKVVDLGVNVKAEMIIETAKKVEADVIGLSALLTTTMPFMKLIVEQIKREGLTIPVICGGAPVSREFAAEIGANGYGDNAPEAVDLCKRLVLERVSA